MSWVKSSLLCDMPRVCCMFDLALNFSFSVDPGTNFLFSFFNNTLVVDMISVSFYSLLGWVMVVVIITFAFNLNFCF